MATPSYKGPQQAVVRTSWLGSWFSATPAYAGAGQSAPAASMFGSSAPAYKPAPMPVADSQQVMSDDSDACGPTAFAIVVPRQ